jgi:hypothetical protein
VVCGSGDWWRYGESAASLAGLQDEGAASGCGDDKDAVRRRPQSPQRPDRLPYTPLSDGEGVVIDGDGDGHDDVPRYAAALSDDRSRRPVVADEPVDDANGSSRVGHGRDWCGHRTTPFRRRR